MRPIMILSLLRSTPRREGLCGHLCFRLHYGDPQAQWSICVSKDAGSDLAWFDFVLPSVNRNIARVLLPLCPQRRQGLCISFWWHLYFGQTRDWSGDNNGRGTHLCFGDCQNAKDHASK